MITILIRLEFESGLSEGDKELTCKWLGTSSAMWASVYLDAGGKNTLSPANIVLPSFKQDLECRTPKQASDTLSLPIALSIGLETSHAHVGSVVGLCSERQALTFLC